MVLLARGAGVPDADFSEKQIAEFKATLREKYGDDLTFIEPKNATPEDVHEAMQEMGEFAKDHPGAESMFFYLAHGLSKSEDPRSASAQLNGGQEGSLHMAKPPGSTDYQSSGLSEKPTESLGQGRLGGILKQSLYVFLLRGQLVYRQDP